MHTVFLDVCNSFFVPVLCLGEDQALVKDDMLPLVFMLLNLSTLIGSVWSVYQSKGCGKVILVALHFSSLLRAPTVYN